MPDRLKFCRMTAVVCICLAGVCAEQPSLISDDDTGSGFTVSFFDVGQGDAALCSDGRYHVLVDGGDYAYGAPLAAELRAAGVDTLDAVILSHPHTDHYGGLHAVLRDIPVRELLYNGMTGGSTGFKAFMALVCDTLMIPVVVTARGGLQVYGTMAFNVLHPADALMAGEDSVNDNSLVCRIDAAGRSVLMTGDVSSLAESLLVTVDAPALAADVLKVPHHGSKKSSCFLFLAAVQPAQAVISCGEDNTYKHPHSRALERYETSGITVLRTDVDGMVVIDLD